jgi:pyruvate/2-oxoacid:ferredoxin oxidoreductase beta subunit/Pyruvate/2-oxoacid:ferredoxin oxidoreductase gamma subunit
VSAVTVTTVYRNERPYPFCPGCGHSSILDALDAALQLRSAAPEEVVIVSDIGCSGLSDQYFSTSAFHGLHGRSITYASGIKLARPDLDVVVVMGDGGTGIGGAHLINASRRNLGLTVLVFNNLNFGMTGGQHSTTTPPGAITSTTPDGNPERPLDVCGTAGVNGAAYTWRGSSFDEDLPRRIADAMEHPGFAVLDIWELCTAYYVRGNRFSRKDIEATMEALGFDRGVLTKRDVVEYTEAIAGAATGDPGPRREALETVFASDLDRPFSIMVAGAAGGKIRSAVRQAGRAGILSGLWAAQRDDYPITVKTGHSVSTLVLAPEPVENAAIEHPDALIALAPEGIAKVGGVIAAMGLADTLFVLDGLEPPATEATQLVIDPGGIAKTDLALAALSAAVERLSLYSTGALVEAVTRSAGRFAERALKAVEAGPSLLTG